MLREFTYRCPEDDERVVVSIRGATPEKPITPSCPRCGMDMCKVFHPPHTHFFKKSGGGTRN